MSFPNFLYPRLFLALMRLFHLVFTYTKSLYKIVLCYFVYLPAFCILFLELIPFELHGKVKFLEEFAAELCRHVVIGFLCQCNFGILWLLRPLFGLFSFLWPLLLVPVITIAIVVEILVFLTVRT